jgi:hypothetical protein
MFRSLFYKRLFFFILLVLIFAGLYYLILVKTDFKFKGARYTEFPAYEKERLALEDFVNKYFLEDGFFKTNLLDFVQVDKASGEDFLSESMGLLMLHYLKIDQERSFENEVNILIEYFLNSHHLIKWRIRRKINQDTVNATIDDLRIIKALIMAAEKWNRDDYKDIAEGFSNRLLKYNLKENKLKAYDSADSPLAPFAYYDFKAMQLMGRFNSKWYDIVDINTERILDKQIEGFPFYKDELYSKKMSFSTAENLMVLMHLSEIGRRDPQSIKWLKEELRQKGLFATYSKEGKPLSTVQSPAIYAITAITGRLNNDQELYELSINRLKGMQNMKKNKYYGGFIDLNNLSSFSFDQLYSLLAY